MPRPLRGSQSEPLASAITLPRGWRLPTVLGRGTATPCRGCRREEIAEAERRSAARKLTKLLKKVGPLAYQYVERWLVRKRTNCPRYWVLPAAPISSRVARPHSEGRNLNHFSAKGSPRGWQLLTSLGRGTATPAGAVEGKEIAEVETPPAARKLTMVAKMRRSASVPSRSPRSQIFTKKSERADLHRSRICEGFGSSVRVGARQISSSTGP